jgi:hypothetical protein
MVGKSATNTLRALKRSPEALVMMSVFLNMKTWPFWTLESCPVANEPNPHPPRPGSTGRRVGSRKRSRLSFPTSVPTSGFASWSALPRRPSREPLSRVTSMWRTRLPPSSTTEAAGPTSSQGRYSKAPFYGSSSSERDGVLSCSSLIRTGILKLAASQAPASGFRRPEGAFCRIDSSS